MFIKSNIPNITMDNISGCYGKYLYSSDTIVISTSCPDKFRPAVIYHELAHASGHDSRLGRIRKLRKQFGKENGEKIEEITADVIAMITSLKVTGNFNSFSSSLFVNTLDRYLYKDIPPIHWTDVKEGCLWFLDEGINKEQQIIREYVHSLGIKTEDYYVR